MSSFMDIALDCASCGWHVFPCEPKKKKAQLYGGFNLATTDDAQIREWWTRFPNANVGIAMRKSGLVVLDCDTGFSNQAEFEAWVASVGLPRTYTIHTGRRTNKETGLPEFGAQLYFAGTGLPTYPWRLDGHSGEVRCGTGHVMAVGSVHPDSGERYEVLVDAPIADVPSWVLNLPRQTRPVNTDGTRGKIPELGGRHDALTREAGAMRQRGHDRDTILEMLIPLNESMCEVPISDGDLEHIADSVSRYKAGEVVPEIVIGKHEEPKEPVDWRTHWHTKEQLFNAPPPTFLIDGFLQRESITAIAAPVGQRKSIIALNVAHALCTKEPLFDQFAVNPKESISRVLYLCPEMGMTSFRNRVGGIGLDPYVCDTFFCRTMNPVTPEDMGDFQLAELLPEEIENAVIIIDTAARFIKGNENDASEMRIFGKTAFSLIRQKAAAVVILFHSSKGAKDTNELTLENVLRGSSELGAFITCCWGTRLQDPSDVYASKSYLRNCKERDFRGKDFEVTGVEPYTDFRLHYVENDGKVTLNKKQGGVKADADGKDAARIALIRANIHLTIDELEKLLNDAGMKCGKTKLKAMRKAIRMELSLAGGNGSKWVSG